MAQCWKCRKRCRADLSCLWCRRGPMCLKCQCDCRRWPSADPVCEHGTAMDAHVGISDDDDCREAQDNTPSKGPF